jgi:hypothetical protein
MSMRSVLALLGVVAALSAAPAPAEESTKVPGYTIHHNALTTGLLAPDVARSYGIQRSTHRGLLNVSVIKDVPGTTGKAATAAVRATSRDVRGTIREIPMREVREGEAVYYLGEFPVEHAETLTFTVDVRPQGEAASYTATLSQEFYTR